MEFEKYKYWILFSILFIALIWTIGKKREAEYFETFVNENVDIEIEMVKFTSLLGLLLDNQEFANAIIINNKLTSVRDLVEKNRKKIKLNLTPILRNDQFRVVTRFLLLNDIYFTINPNDKKNEERIIAFSRKEELVKPKELYKTADEEDAQIGSFRKNFHLNKTMYLEYDWISNKSKDFLRNYGLSMLAQSETNLKEVYGDNYWQGMKYLAKSDLYDMPIYTLLYMKTTEQLYFKTNKDNDQWFVTPIDSDKNVTILQRIISDPSRNWEYWSALLSKKSIDGLVKSNQLPNGDYFLIRTSSSFNLSRLYRKIDEMSQNDFFSLNPEYDTKINLPSGLEKKFTLIERMNLFKKWIERKTTVEEEQKMLLENIIFDLNHRVINIFDDILCFLIFHQHTDFSEVYLDNYLRLNSPLNSWWSGYDVKSVLINGTGLGQCFLPASFSISKIQESPPIFKFIYNRNLYHTFWDPLTNHIDDMKLFLTEKFKSSVVSEIAPIARFCLFNNTSLREYLAKYVACNADKCDTNLLNMKEPERCGALKLKYQELMNKKMEYKCFYRSKTDSNPVTDKSNIDNIALKKMSQEEEDKYVNQLFGFQNILLLDLITYAMKYHKCQTESISIKDCQGLTSKIDTTDQKDDLKMDEIVVDRQSDLSNVYDIQLANYNNILKNQEIKKLEPLNILSNLKEKEDKKRAVNNFSIFNKASDDFYNIINDLTNIKLDGNSSYSKTQVEPFDNQLIENLDLNEATIKDYKDRLQRQIQGISGENTMGFFNKIINVFYQIIEILTKESRIATSGMVLVIISMTFYFIDITS